MRITIFLLSIAIRIPENFTYQHDNSFNFINKHVLVNMYILQCIFRSLSDVTVEGTMTPQA